jgi:hypothetical protein
MAVDTDARDDLLDALEEGEGEASLEDFVEWAQSILDLNQVNSELKAELLFFINEYEENGD